jgi:hypothetical protein
MRNKGAFVETATPNHAADSIMNQARLEAAAPRPLACFSGPSYFHSPRTYLNERIKWLPPAMLYIPLTRANMSASGSNPPYETSGNLHCSRIENKFIFSFSV